MEFSVRDHGASWCFSEEYFDGMTCWKNTVLIKPGQRGRNELDTWVHEAVHAVLGPDERIPNRVARLVSSVLWKAGYRRKSVKSAGSSSVHRDRMRGVSLPKLKGRTRR